MAGICGLVSLGADLPQPDILERMLTTLKANINDISNITINGHCGLGQVGTYGALQNDRKPLIVEHILSGTFKRRASIVLDGEIYNHTDIQNALHATRHQFQTNLDTETVARSYIQFGEDSFLKPFRGNFALALWDDIHAKLILARDRLGRKPLYYAVTKNWFIFASKIAAIRSHPEVSAQFDIAALRYLMMNGYLQSHTTLFEGIVPILPGHMLVVDGKDVTLQQSYWNVPESASGLDERLETDIAADLLAHMRGATRTRLADTQVDGIYLSGTLESACLVSIVIEESVIPIRGFSIRFIDDYDLTRSRSIRQLAAYFVIDHTEITLGTLTPSKLVELISYADYPPASTMAILYYLLYETAEDAGKILLTDEGGSDIFGSSLLWGSPFNNVLDYHKSPSEIARQYLQTHRPAQNNDINRMGVFYTLDNRLNIDSIIKSDSDDSVVLARLLDLHLRTTVIGAKLDMLDWYSQPKGGSIRAPYLDHQLIQYICGIPVVLREGIGHPSRILSGAFSHLVPGQILRQQHDAPIPPIDFWLRGELGLFAQEVFAQDNPILAQLVNMEAVRQTLAQHREGGLQAGNIIWMILSAAIWLQLHISRDNHTGRLV